MARKKVTATGAELRAFDAWAESLWSGPGGAGWYYDDVCEGPLYEGPDSVAPTAVVAVGEAWAVNCLDEWAREYRGIPLRIVDDQLDVRALFVRWRESLATLTVVVKVPREDDGKFRAVCADNGWTVEGGES